VSFGLRTNDSSSYLRLACTASGTIGIQTSGGLADDCRFAGRSNRGGDADDEESTDCYVDVMRPAVGLA
jgi:hypothetical protein